MGFSLPSEALPSESLFSEFEARIRAIVEDDQGALYLLTDSDNGSIIKIERSDSPVG